MAMPSNRKQAWSYSALSMYEQCPKKYYHLKIRKDYKEPDSEWQADGKFIHNAVHQYVIHGTSLPPQLRFMKGQVDKIASIPGDREAEMKLCLNDVFKPVAWFAKDVWVRAVVDLLIWSPPNAVLVDWKTGKQREGFSQLQLSAAILSRVLPEITKFHMIYAWLQSGVTTRATILRTELRPVWLNFLPRAARIDKAKAATTFDANPGPLCRYCCITSCPHYGER